VAGYPLIVLIGFFGTYHLFSQAPKVKRF